ncbi:MAG: hypothetical protein MUP70_12855 [Candidatus Aminicenantes bacterium]|nr:hypothetical protein [Candidatus Aminicenantes bacterium]
MKKKKSSPIERRIIIFAGVICFSILLSIGLNAQTISQQIGMRDVEFANLLKNDCQKCHGTSLVDQHHGTSRAKSGDCAFCHAVTTQAKNVGVSLQRDCMICHKTSPHHSTEAAINKECTTCHDSAGLSDYSVIAPSYKISGITPQSTSCKICHAENKTAKIAGLAQSHHSLNLKDCNICHEGEEKKDTNIRVCERCHNVKALHQVLPHVQDQNCKVCHLQVKTQEKK